MAEPKTVPEAPRRRRLTPDYRRQEILEAARRLFAERSYGTVTTADIAEAADVARSLVHHYFGGVREVFLAVMAQGATALTDGRTAGPETPFKERTARNIAVSLDAIAANRETWLAVTGLGASPPDEQILAFIAAAGNAHINRTLAANADLLTDTPATRFTLRCFNQFSITATRAWLQGEATRDETEALLLTVIRNLIQNVIPALERERAT